MQKENRQILSYPSNKVDKTSTRMIKLSQFFLKQEGREQKWIVKSFEKKCKKTKSILAKA